MRAVTDAFTIDDAHDRDRASDGVSRYGQYLDICADSFEDEPRVVTTDPATFVSVAFFTASPPNMAPGYVVNHARVIGAVVYRAMDSSDLIADVTLASWAPPPQLRYLPGWVGWHQQDGRPWEPSEATLASIGALMTSVRALWLIDAGRLHVPQDAPGRLTVQDAKASVARLVELLNERLGPVLDALEGGR